MVPLVAYSFLWHPGSWEESSKVWWKRLTLWRITKSWNTGKNKETIEVELTLLSSCCLMFAAASIVMSMMWCCLCKVIRVFVASPSMVSASQRQLFTLHTEKHDRMKSMEQQNTGNLNISKYLHFLGNSKDYF